MVCDCEEIHGMNSGDKINIMVCGLLWSGSSAVIDLLSEYDCVGRVPGEFDEFRWPGMIGDHLEGLVSDNNPSQIQQWIDRHTNYVLTGGYKVPIKKLLLRTPLRKYIKYSPNRPRRYEALQNLHRKLVSDLSYDKKINYAKQWFNEIRSRYSDGKSHLLLDQPIFYSAHKKIWPLVYQPFKMIVVFRNPRDQMANIIRRRLLFDHIGLHNLDVYGRSQRALIQCHADILQARIQHAILIRDELGYERVKFVRFEDLVIHYEHMKRMLQEYLQLEDKHHIHRQQAFNPAASVLNVGIAKSILSVAEYKQLNSVCEMVDQVAPLCDTGSKTC